MMHLIIDLEKNLFEISKMALKNLKPKTKSMYQMIHLLHDLVYFFFKLESNRPARLNQLK